MYPETANITIGLYLVLSIVVSTTFRTLLLIFFFKSRMRLLSLVSYGTRSRMASNNFHKTFIILKKNFLFFR